MATKRKRRDSLEAEPAAAAAPAAPAKISIPDQLGTEMIFIEERGNRLVKEITELTLAEPFGTLQERIKLNRRVSELISVAVLNVLDDNLFPCYSHIRLMARITFILLAERVMWRFLYDGSQEPLVTLERGVPLSDKSETIHNPIPSVCTRICKHCHMKWTIRQCSSGVFSYFVDDFSKCFTCTHVNLQQAITDRYSLGQQLTEAHAIAIKRAREEPDNRPRKRQRRSG